MELAPDARCTAVLSAHMRECAALAAAHAELIPSATNRLDEARFAALLGDWAAPLLALPR
jgi:hypothetical protein